MQRLPAIPDPRFDHGVAVCGWGPKQLETAALKTNAVFITESMGQYILPTVNPGHTYIGTTC